MTDRDKINHLIQWKDGNGAMGAEQRLQEVEIALRGCVDKGEMISIKKHLRQLTIAIFILAIANGPEALQSIINMVGRFL